MRQISPPFLLLPILLAPVLLCPAATSAQSLPAGNWAIKSTAVDLEIPGAPGFMLRMMRGNSKTEHKCIAPDQARTGVATLFVPRPDAKCTVERAQFDGGRIDHVMLCPQKKGPPMRVVRAGSYGASGFTARMTMTGQTDKGAMRIVADQVATRAGPTCKG